MKFLLVALNAKYIHSNPALHSLRAYAGDNYQENIELKMIEQQAQKEFYKYIHYNKLQNRYHIIYKATTLATYKSLKEALIERDLIVKYDGDEELMCEAEINYEYYKQNLPPFPTK